MRIRLGVSPEIPTDTMGEAIDAALEASAVSQVPLIATGKVPDIRDAIRAGRVRWKPEPPGDEHFDDAKTVLKRGWGDCDDLAPWLAASLRATGEAPHAQPYVYQSGPRRWHAVVDRGDGKTLDPSAWAGMNRRRAKIDGYGVGAGAPIWSPMWLQKLAMAAHPHSHGWAGRVDVPDQSLPLSWSTITHGRSPRQAILSAIQGACGVADVAGDVAEDDMARLVGIEALIASNGDLDVAADVLGDEYVGILPLLAPAAASMAMPMANKLLSSPMKMFGGLFGKKKKSGGAPAAPPPGGVPPSPTTEAMARNAASPGSCMTAPGGPIIVRF